MELTACPECAQPAEVQWRTVLESSAGPVEHVKVFCIRRHWFLLPTATFDLSSPHELTTHAARATKRRSDAVG